MCLDFDGTAVDYEGDITFFHQAVSEELNRLGDRGVKWCTNSGRSKEDQERILRVSQARGLHHMPAAILCSEAFIFDRGEDSEFIAREPWNSQVAKQLASFHAAVQARLKAHFAEWQGQYEVDIRVGADHTVFCVSGEDVRVDAFCGELSAALDPVSGFVVTRNGGWVVVLPENLGKGNVLDEYRRQHGFQREEVLAMGDHLNDISMLDGRAARWVACPSDAKQPVIDVVRKAQGWVAASPGPVGTAEILRRIRAR